MMSERILSELASYNATFTLVSIGMAVAEYAVLPPEFEPISADQLFQNIDMVYQEQHQGDVGRLITHKIAERHYQIETVTPYPDDFWYGNYYALCLHFFIDKLKHRVFDGTRSVT